MIETIVIIHDQAYISGGAAKIAIEEAKKLKEFNYRVIYFTSLGPIDKSLLNCEVEVHCINGEHIGKPKSIKGLFNGLWNNTAMRELLYLLQKLDKEKTIIHVHGWTKSLSSSIFYACNKSKIKTFVTLHDYFSICQNGGLYNYKKDYICNQIPGSTKCFLCNCDKKNYLHKIYRDVRQLIGRRTFNKCNPTRIYISSFSKKIFELYDKKYQDGKIIENYVEVLNTDQIKVKNNNLYLYIGRLSNEKNPKLFCEAVTQANVKGVVIGDGPQFKELRTDYPNICFTGWLNVEEMQPYINKARCLVITSKLYETMGLTIIEMQARGIPCILPDQFAGRDYVRDKYTGCIYRSNDFVSLVEAITKLKNSYLINYYGDMFYKEYNQNRFSKDTYIKNLITLFEGNYE